jgi:hypothetical protein
MTDEAWMTLIRVAIIVFPAGFACFLVGFLYGRSTAYRMTGQITKITMPAIDEPDQIQEAKTLVTKRNRKVII